MVQTSSKKLNFPYELKLDLEDQGRSLHKTIGTLTKVFDLRTAQVYCDPFFWSARKCI